MKKVKYSSSDDEERKKKSEKKPIKEKTEEDRDLKGRKEKAKNEEEIKDYLQPKSSDPSNNIKGYQKIDLKFPKKTIAEKLNYYPTETQKSKEEIEGKTEEFVTKDYDSLEQKSIVDKQLKEEPKDYRERTSDVYEKISEEKESDETKQFEPLVPIEPRKKVKTFFTPLRPKEPTTKSRSRFNILKGYKRRRDLTRKKVLLYLVPVKKDPQISYSKRNRGVNFLRSIWVLFKILFLSVRTITKLAYYLYFLIYLICLWFSLIMIYESYQYFNGLKSTISKTEALINNFLVDLRVQDFKLLSKLDYLYNIDSQQRRTLAQYELNDYLTYKQVMTLKKLESDVKLTKTDFLKLKSYVIRNIALKYRYRQYLNLITEVENSYVPLSLLVWGLYANRIFFKLQRSRTTFFVHFQKLLDKDQLSAIDPDLSEYKDEEKTRLRIQNLEDLTDLFYDSGQPKYTEPSKNFFVNDTPDSRQRIDRLLRA